MDFKFFYCPCCGKIICSLEESKKCCFCDTEMTYVKQSKEWDEKSVDDREKLISQFRETIVKANPLYNKEKYEAREYDETHMEYGISSYTAKCPTCGSPNVTKISTASKVGKVVLFGIFAIGNSEKTFKCNNCGMKF